MVPVIEGSLSFTVRIKSPSDLKRIQAVLESIDEDRLIENQPAKTKKASSATTNASRGDPDIYIQTLQSELPAPGFDSFTKSEADDLMRSRFDRGASTTARALQRAREKRLLISRGGRYFWTDSKTQQAILAKAQQLHQRPQSALPPSADDGASTATTLVCTTTTGSTSK